MTINKRKGTVPSRNKDIAKLAIWDDHDFGMNNACGDENHAEREGSLAAFRQHMDFLANPDKTKVYCSYEIGDVKVIMLDVRFYRQRVKKVGDAVTLLGDEQTDWLWKELHHDKKFTVIGSGSTIAEGELGESVQDYQPFYGQLADRLQALGNVLFLSGDIHYNRFNDHWIERSDPTDPKGLRTIKEFGFFEATSSGVSNQVFREAAGKWVDINNWGLLTFDEKEVLVDLYRGKNQSRTKIDIQSWKVIKN